MLERTCAAFSNQRLASFRRLNARVDWKGKRRIARERGDVSENNLQSSQISTTVSPRNPVRCTLQLIKKVKSLEESRDEALSLAERAQAANASVREALDVKVSGSAREPGTAREQSPHIESLRSLRSIDEQWKAKMSQN